MYLASLAHAVLRTHKEAASVAHMMGSSLADNNEDYKQWLESNTFGSNENSTGSKHFIHASDEDVKRWLESHNNTRYGESAAEINEDLRRPLKSQNSNKKYGASSNTKDVNVRFGDNEGPAWQDYVEAQKNGYGKANDVNGIDFGASSTSDSKTKDANVRFRDNEGPAWQDYVDAQKNGYGKANDVNGIDFGASSTSDSKTKDANVRFRDNEGPAWQDYVDAQKNGYGEANDVNGIDKSSQVKPKLAASSLNSEQQQKVVACFDYCLASV